MSPRTGRPLTGEHKKDIDIKVRVDNKTNEKLLSYCKEHNITKAEAVRQGVDLLLGKK